MAMRVMISMRLTLRSFGRMGAIAGRQRRFRHGRTVSRGRCPAPAGPLLAAAAEVAAVAWVVGGQQAAARAAVAELAVAAGRAGAAAVGAVLAARWAWGGGAGGGEGHCQYVAAHAGSHESCCTSWKMCQASRAWLIAR